MRILTIDGGGLRGLFALRILARLERELGSPLRNHFDMIVGTSTGSILAFSLALEDVSAEELSERYEAFGHRVFPGGLKADFRGITRTFFKGSWWKKNDLKTVLHEQFGDGCLKDLRMQRVKVACIASNLNASPGSTFVFRSYPTPGGSPFEGTGNAQIVDAILASCSAPLYFDLAKHRTNQSTLYLGDGGLVANNPAGVAVVEALHMPTSLENLRVLSVGTGLADGVDLKDVVDQWLASLIRKTVETAMNTDVVDALLRAQLGERYIRLNGPTSQSEMDHVQYLPTWRKDGDQAARYEDWDDVLRRLHS
jgi:patatin-like phospholipase/acyl hydrolase